MYAALSKNITEINKQRRIKKAQKALWNLVCAARPNVFKCFILKEYEEFRSLGPMLSDFTYNGEFVSHMKTEEKVLFILFLIEAFPDLVDEYGNTYHIRNSNLSAPV